MNLPWWALPLVIGATVGFSVSLLVDVDEPPSLPSPEVDNPLVMLPGRDGPALLLMTHATLDGQGHPEAYQPRGPGVGVVAVDVRDGAFSLLWFQDCEDGGTCRSGPVTWRIAATSDEGARLDEAPSAYQASYAAFTLDGDLVARSADAFAQPGTGVRVDSADTWWPWQHAALAAPWPDLEARLAGAGPGTLVTAVVSDHRLPVDEPVIITLRVEAIDASQAASADSANPVDPHSGNGDANEDGAPSNGGDGDGSGDDGTGGEGGTGGDAGGGDSGGDGGHGDDDHGSSDGSEDPGDDSSDPTNPEGPVVPPSPFVALPGMDAQPGAYTLMVHDALLAEDRPAGIDAWTDVIGIVTVDQAEGTIVAWDCATSAPPCPTNEVRFEGPGGLEGTTQLGDGRWAVDAYLWVFDEDGELVVSNGPDEDIERFGDPDDVLILYPEDTRWWIGPGDAPPGTTNLPIGKPEARALLDGATAGHAAVTIFDDIPSPYSFAYDVLYVAVQVLHVPE